MKISGVKGMNDVLPAEVARWQEMERVAREVFALYGYREVRTPAVEHAQLFARGVGEATDIVNKEMYVFEDKGEELLALRPEGTAGTVRAFIEHGAYVEGPQKWFYMGPMFRRERPQKGRYRQFHQIGCEAFGIAEPFIDAEQIALVADYFARLGGPPTPGIGFALGEERLAMILEKAGKAPPAQGPVVFFVTADAEGAIEALRRAAELRRAGIPCDLDPRGGKMKAQFKQAERVGARYALVLGSAEVRSG